MILYQKSIFQEKIPRWGFNNIYRVAFENCYRREQKFLRSTFFSRYADCQLGGVPRKCQHSVSMGGGSQNGPFQRQLICGWPLSLDKKKLYFGTRFYILTLLCRSAAPNCSASRKNSKSLMIVPPWIVLPVGKCQVYRFEFPKQYIVFI